MTDVAVIDKSLTLENIKERRALMEIQEGLILQQELTSTDPNAILKAHVYLNEMNKRKNDSKTKAFLYAPENEFIGMSGYRTPMKSVSFTTLRNMARTPVIRTIVGTRSDQVAAHAEPTENVQEKGWQIICENGKADKDIVKTITKSIMEGGFNTNIWEFDSFEAILRQMVRDSLELDQICVEVVENKKGQPMQFVPVDAATIRLTDPMSSQMPLPQKYGYDARYVQEWNQRIYSYFFSWEMTFGIRNKSTDIFTNGYGISELEDMINIVTGLLNAVQYNTLFFSQGSNPKGFFAIKGNLGANSVADFKQMWRNTITGVNNAWKVPVIESPDGDVQWIPMNETNVDMMFHDWLEFLIVMACCIFKIDPSECGWNFGKLANSLPFGQDGQKQRLKHSQSKGLVPVMKLIQRVITKHWVKRIDEDYAFVFTGVEQEDQVQALDMDVKKVGAGLMSLEDGFKKWSNRRFNPEKDTILNPVYLQVKQQEQVMVQEAMMGMMGGEAGMGGGEMGAENPFVKSMNTGLKKFGMEIVPINDRLN
jgi:hypothetical protein